MKAVEDIKAKDKTKLLLAQQAIEHLGDGISRIEKQLECMNKNFDRLDKRLDKLENNIDGNFKWLLGILISGLSGILGILAHGLKWL